MKCSRCRLKDVKNGVCDSCKASSRAYYKRHRKQEIERVKRFQNADRARTNAYKRALHRKNPINILLQSARRRAKILGLPFNIKSSDLVMPDTCPVLGIKLAVSNGHATDSSPSIDRMVPELGYVRGNVAIISHKANTIKNNATVEELEMVISWLKHRYQKLESDVTT